MPSRSTIALWESSNAHGFSEAYARAFQASVRARVQETAAIADAPPKLHRGKVDMGAEKWRDTRIRARQWLAERVLPQEFGEHKHVAMSVEVEPANMTDAELDRLIAFGKPLLEGSAETLPDANSAAAESVQNPCSLPDGAEKSEGFGGLQRNAAPPC
jgi:hypothetical protein